MDNLWVNTLAKIEAEGHQLGSRDGQSCEILGFSAKLDDVTKTFLFNKVRGLSPYYACAEFLWYMSMTDDTSFLQLFAPSYKKFTEDGIHAFGAYGWRWAQNCEGYRSNHIPCLDDQITMLIKTLQRHPESRQAVVTMWHGTDIHHALTVDRKDLPCTLTHQFLLRDGYLHLVTNMRSNDAWLGLPYDVFCNTQLQKLIADILGVSVGSYTHNVGSMHYYERNFEKIDQILSAKREKIDAPISLHKAGTSSLGFREQVEVAIGFIYSIKEQRTQETLNEVETFHSIVSDTAFLCASKWDSKLVKYIYDPQLRRAVDEQK